MGVSECQGEDAAERATIDDDTGQKTNGALDLSADQFLFVGSASHMMHVLLEADPEIDLGLAEHVGKSKSKQAGKRAGQHAPDEERPHHDDYRWRLMTGEAE